MKLLCIMKRFSVVICAVASMSSPVFADTVLAPGASWEYMITDHSVVLPGGDPSWNTTLGGGWAVGAAPFGNTGSGDFGANTSWPAGNLLWVRRAVDFSGFDLSTAHWDLGVDNGFDLYANGTFVAGANAEGFTFRWEYGGGFGASLHPGVNIIALALEDHGGATAFDMQITATAAPAIPEPESYAMLLAGLGLLGFVTRRRKQRAA